MMKHGLRCVALACASLALWLTSGCSTEDLYIDGNVLIDLSVEGDGDGSVSVIEVDNWSCTLSDGIIERSTSIDGRTACTSAFFDAGGGGTVSFVAHPDANSVFGGWGLDCSGTSDCDVDFVTDGGKANIYVEATFLLKPASVEITVTDHTPDVGTTTTASATAAPPAGRTLSDVDFEWSSNAPGVAAVSGTSAQTTIAAVGLGSAEITATARGVESDPETVTPSPSQAAATFVHGTMMGGDGMTPLPGIPVGISRSGTGIGNAVTDAQGYFRIEVTPGGSLNLFASGVCDLEHTCDTELSYNSTEAEALTVQEGDDDEFNPEARRGYHLEFTSGAQDQIVQHDADFQVQLDYTVWNRANLPGGAPRIALGFDETFVYTTAQFLPGAYPPGPQGTGTVDETLKAPSTPGTYGVYALLVTATGSTSSASEYQRLYPNSRLFIRVFTLTVQ